jgi:hypothetical protein
MASNFRIYRRRNRDNLHLKLEGDFDGSSALELISAIEEHGADFPQILINTNDLKTIYPVGSNVFQKNLGRFNKKRNHLIFIGENGNCITSDSSTDASDTMKLKKLSKQKNAY